MRSNKKTRFRWLKLRFRRSLAVSLAAFMVWPMLLPAMALATTGGNNHPACTDATYEGANIDPGPNTWNAPTGYVYTEVTIKAGSDNQEGAGHLPAYTQDTPIGGDGDYSVIGIGTNSLTVARVGDGPETKDISHIDVCWELAPIFGLDVDKSVTDSTIDDGEDTTFTITVENTGNTTLSNVNVEDTLPSGLVYVDSDPNSTGIAPNLSWTIASLAPGPENAWTATVTVRGDNDGESSIEPTNLAVASEDSHELEAQDPERVVVNPKPEEPQTQETTYTITKTDSTDPVIVGENTTYTITVDNTGDTTLTDVSVNDAMPAGLEYVSAEPAPDTTDPLGWDLPDLGPDSDPYVIKVRAKALTVGSWTNAAHVHVDERPAVYAYEDTAVSSKPPVNETTTETVLPPVVAPAVYGLLIKKIDNVDPANISDTVTYTVTVRNTGNQPLTGLSFTDSLPAGLTFKSSSTGMSKQSFGVYGWSLAKLDAGESRTFKIATIAGKAGLWTNTVSVTAKELPTPKRAGELTTVLARLAVAPQASDVIASAGTSSGSLPFTGFPVTIWWLATMGVLASGLWLEISSRRKVRNN